MDQVVLKPSRVLLAIPFSAGAIGFGLAIWMLASGWPMDLLFTPTIVGAAAAVSAAVGWWWSRLRVTVTRDTLSVKFGRTVTVPWSAVQEIRFERSHARGWPQLHVGLVDRPGIWVPQVLRWRDYRWLVGRLKESRLRDASADARKMR